ncbi:MAG TPA: hypothetical protein VFL99_11785 [Segeticoccus sp.]|uniref:hypothetical protein n=1 Tax=Segeticoccus sp. TaxID=2706531 RepID=UPI002D8072BB|nr:hypothetical protein [Segeticoccus sp.]HET8600998.1 hypothetical protein [Segeticoccus sp.]
MSTIDSPQRRRIARSARPATSATVGSKTIVTGTVPYVAAATWADYLFMIGLAGIGIGLTFGIAMRLSTISAVAMLVLMWSATLLPTNNPFLDDHLIYAIAALALLAIGAGHTLGLGKAWDKLTIVRNHPVLR